MPRETDNTIHAPLVIAAAIAAAGKNDGPQWKKRVLTGIPEIAAMFDEGAREWKAAEEVLGAAIFTGAFVDFELEESSQRLIVRIDVGRASRNYEDGIEPIRTHRIDNPQGAAMHEKLKKLEPGSKVMCWRHMDDLPNGDKARLLAHIRFLAKPDGAQQQTHTVQPDDGPPPEPRESKPAAAVSDSDVEFAVGQFNDLNGKDKAACVRIFREEGIAFPMPEPGQVNDFLAVIGRVTGT